jgi:cell division protein FtsW
MPWSDGWGKTMVARSRASKKPDYALLFAVVSLVVFGLIMIFSATFTWPDPGRLVRQQAVRAVLGFAVLAITTQVDYRLWRRWAVPIMGISVILLVAVLVFGEQSETGARSWFLGDALQPSEIAKLAFIIYLAAWLDSKGDRIKDMTLGLLPFSILLGLVAGLVVMQRDLGTAILIMVTAVTMFFFAGADVMQIVMALVVGVPVVGFLITRHEYLQKRILVFLNPESDPLDASFHIRSIFSALRAGGIKGRGLGAGTQKLLKPYVHHTDTIFSVIGEELGLIGCLLIMGLFLYVAYRGMTVSFRASDRFGTLLATGVTSWIVFQAMVHIAGNTGALPFTGITLPFVSYGGSSLVMSLAGVGVLLNISRAVKRRRLRTSAAFALGWGDRRPRLSRTRRR